MMPMILPIGTFIERFLRMFLLLWLGESEGMYAFLRICDITGSFTITHKSV